MVGQGYTDPPTELKYYIALQIISPVATNCHEDLICLLR